MLHKGYKTFHVYKNIRCTNCDNVNFCVEDLCELNKILTRCKIKHPNCNIWYECINIRPINNSHNRFMCDLRVVYKPTSESTQLAGLKTKIVDGRRVINKPSIKAGTNRPKITSTVNGLYKVDGHKFVGTADDCNKYINMYINAPECYKALMIKCKDFVEYNRLYSNSVISKSQKLHKSESFHSRMNSGNRYNY